MKKRLLFWAMAVVLGLSFISCGSDDDKPDYALEVEGEYEGPLTISRATGNILQGGVLEMQPLTTVWDTIRMVRTAENEVKLVLEDFALVLPGPTPIPIGTIEVENIGVGKEEGFFRLSGTDSIDLTAQQLGSGTIQMVGRATLGYECMLGILVQLTTPGQDPVIISIDFETENFQ